MCSSLSLSLYTQACTECNGNVNPSNCMTNGGNGQGVSGADFVLYVSAIANGCSATTIAFAGACQMEAQYDRYRLPASIILTDIDVSSLDQSLAMSTSVRE